ncbi:ankyrin repeat domain-containing protein 26-like isoform X2 [Acipenser ruthenus]|uniref:ankyrin repeat domain-containing protein 26-like isoform X2 n=1 Tax=Acipenser ruthenus TaxID=7906 RepID=UPI0027424A43|nr:ankyrin repeat domain-containing protein 26-like isoform X2 [Acipenser ruthenus]
MKKLFSFGKKKKGFSPNTSDTGSVVSAGYELKEKDLGKLHKAASTGDLSKLKQLAKKHDLSQLDKENRTPLHLACAHGHVDVVHFLTESKAKLNLCDNDNRSPLMKAVQCQQEHCAVTLLEHDADPNLVDINGNTALHLAALIPAISMAIQLLDHDARINATNKEGCTPLILAATENHQEMVEYLLKEGADVDAKDKSKRTSLMIAASNGQISLVRLLLRYDADISIKDDNGWTADDYAVMNGHHACSHLIIEHGTKKRPPQSPHGTSKVKGASVFSSPIRGTESGFAVGGPATDKEELQQSPKHQSGAGDSGKVGDNVSPDESISRVSEKDGAGDSWPSSDEGEELDFSPKKIQKPSLTKLMNASQKSKNNGTVCDEPGVLEKATTSRQSSAEQEENESENEEEDEDDEDEEEDEEEEGDEDEDEEDLEDEEEDEEEEASEEDDGGVASLEHENHERTEITVANLCSVVGETVQGQETISRGLDQTAAIGTSVAKGEVSAGEVVAGRDVSVNERGAADEVTGGDQLVADEESSEDQDIEVNEVVHSAVVGHESLSCHNDDGNAESPDRVSALADSWDSEEDNFKDEHPEPKADWQKMEETNDVPVSLIIGHYEGAFDLTTANSWNEMEGKNCKAQVSKIDDQTENIACEENSRNEEEVSQNSDLEIQDIQSGVCSSSVMGHHKHEEDNKESGEESEASVQEMKMEVTDIIEDSGANIMNSGKDSNDKEEVALKPSPSDNEEDSWDTDQEIQNCSEKLVQHKDREGDDFKSCQEKSDLSHGSRKWDEGAYSNTNDVNKSLEKGSNENEGPEIIIWDEDKQHQSVTKQGSNQDRKDAGDDLLDYSCEEKGNLMIHLQQNHSIQDIEKGSESDISWGERSGRPQEPEVFDVNMTSHPEPLQMDQENRVVRTTEKDRSKDFKLLKPAAEMEEYSEEEDEEEEEEEYEDLHISGNILKESGTVDSAVPQNDLDEKGSPEKNLKRDFLSELGLEAAEEDEDSLWDSESASDSPRKQQSGALNPAAKAQTVMHSISEEKNEDIFYIPSFLRGSRDYRMAELEDSRSVGRPVSRLRLDLGGNDTEKQKDVLKTPLKIKETVFSNLAVSKETREKQKTDFMEELGLDDADDIEEHEKLSKDASDWDSASIASRNLPGCKIPLPVHDEISAKLSEPELSTPQRKTPNVVQCAKADQKTSAEKSLSPSNSPPLPKARSLHSLTPPQPQPRSKLLAVKAESREDSDWVSEDDDVPSGTEQSGTVLKLSVQNFATSKPEPTDEELSSEEDDDRENSAHLKKKVKQDKERLETPLTVLINTTHDGEDQADNLLGEQNQEGSENQTTVYLSAASSAVPWEERYEKIWVENEKREVKSHYKDVAAELKKKFGEICLKQSSEPSSISTHLRVDLNNEDDSSDEDEIVYQMAKTQSGILQPIPEQKESSLEDSITEPSKPELKGSKIPDKAVNSNKQAEHPSKEDDNEIQPPVQKRENDIAGYDTDLDSDSEQSAEEKTKCNIDGSGSSVENNTNPDHSKNSKEEDDDNKYQDFVNAGQKNTPLSEDDFELIPTSQPVCAPASKYPSDEELEGDMQRFKNEVGMLKVVFLALEKEKAQLQKEVEGEKKKKLLGMQRSNQIKGLAGPINVNRQTGNVTEKIIQHEATQRLQPKGMQGSEKVDTCNQKDQKQLNNPRSNIKQRANATHAKRADLVSDEEDVDNKRISKLNTAGRQSQQATFVNGDQLSVFDDSTLSEMSEDGGRPTIPHNWKSKSNKQMETAGDFDDFTQSSDTATDSMESPTLGYRNASLLIKQLETGTIDSVTLIKIQNMFYDYERTIEREKGRYSLLSDKIAQHVNERKELQKALEDIQEVKSTLEHQQVEWETDLNNQKFILKQEQEKHKNAEMLYEKSREQLRKKEEQFRKEVEAKQQLELTLRNLEMEMRALISNMKQLEDERNELQRLLSQERSARALQEGILNNHLHRQKEIEEENKKTVSKNTEVFSQLSEVSDREKDLLQQNRSLQDEISVLKLELDRVRARSQEEEGRYLEENEALKEKMEDLKRDLKLNEEALAQTVLQYSGQLNALKTESTMMTSKMEQEKQNKDKLETDVESLRARLTSALQELERSQSGKVDAERTFQRERDEWLRLQEKHTHETTSLRDSINSLSQQLSKAEAKANSLENECHRATLSHTEKSLMLESMQREREQAQSRLKELEGLLQAEKEQASKSSVRQESMQERMAQAQSENIILRQQLEESQNKGIIKERAVSDVQDRFSDIITNLRADSEGRVQIVEERNKELMAKNIELREQVYRHQNEKAEREFITEHESSFDHKIIIQSVPLHYQAALRQLQQELADALKKLSMSEASLEVNTRYRNDLEAEKIRFQKDIDRLKGKLQETEDQFIQSEHRIHKLKSALDDKEREVIASSQKLQEILSASSGMEKTVKQLDEHIQRLEIENARLEATAKQQTNRIEVLQKEVHGSAAVQNRLEDLVTNLQGAKINLEEQLNQEAQKQSMLSHNAQDSHLLWEEELKSRSKLGLRLAQLEREKVEVTSQMETEKKKTKKIAELKRSTEARLDQEMKRNSELQKEINRMRTLVKTAKKKQKQQETGEFASQLSSIRGELDNRHLETGTTIARLKSKIDELSQQLEKESLQSTRLESTNNDLREQLSSMKALRKSHEKLERSKRQLEEEVSRVRRHIETNMMDHSQIEQCKREAEERARQEIRQKLEEVNLFLQTQAASQEALEQIKATNEATLRNQLEQRIRDLEGELSRARSTQQNSLSQRDSTQTELERYKELYSEEFKLRKSLAAKLDRSNERLAEANTKLLNERQRSKSFIASSIVNGSLTASPVLDVNQLQGSIGNFGGTLGPLHRNLGLGGSFLNPVGDGTSPNSRVDAYIAKMQNELEKNITKELDHATAELDGGSTRMSPVGSAAGSLKTLNLDQDPVTRATQQYLEVLKKNYMI